MTINITTNTSVKNLENGRSLTPDKKNRLLTKLEQHLMQPTNHDIKEDFARVYRKQNIS